MQTITAGRVMSKKKPGPEPTGRRPTAVTVKGSEEWRAWLEEGAKHCLTDVSKLIDVAVTRYLESQGFAKKRPER